KHRIRLDQHLANIGERLTSRVAQLEQLLRVAELSQQMSDVTNNLRIADPNFVSVMSSNQLHKKLLQWVIVGNQMPSKTRGNSRHFAMCNSAVTRKQVTSVSRPLFDLHSIRNPRRQEGFSSPAIGRVRSRLPIENFQVSAG